MNLKKLLKIAFIWGFALMTLGGCAYRPSDPNRTTIDNPIVRKVAWYSYLDAGDIREKCSQGSPDSYRLVYNGQYEKQLRTYELEAKPEGGAILIARAISDQAAFNLNLLGPEDVFGPWKWLRSMDNLDATQFADFKRRLAESGFHDGSPAGLRLYSRDFYWVAAGCEKGQFHYFAWVDAKGHFSRIRFKDFLLSHDQTGLSFREPLPVRDYDRSSHVNKNNDNVEPIFALTVGEEGIEGLANF